MLTQIYSPVVSHSYWSSFMYI